MPCSYCQERGHNIITCPIYKEKQDAKRERIRVRRVEKEYKKVQIINQKLREHKLLEKENGKLRSKTEKQDKTIRRLRKKITEKNKTALTSLFDKLSGSALPFMNNFVIGRWRHAGSPSASESSSKIESNQLDGQLSSAKIFLPENALDSFKSIRSSHHIGILENNLS